MRENVLWEYNIPGSSVLATSLDMQQPAQAEATVGLNEQEVLKNVSAVLLTVPIGDYGTPFNALNGKIFGWEIFAQFKFWPK